jgi:hypothetical protein
MLMLEVWLTRRAPLPIAGGVQPQAMGPLQLGQGVRDHLRAHPGQDLAHYAL